MSRPIWCFNRTINTKCHRWGFRQDLDRKHYPMYFICLTPEAISKVTINPTEHTEETCRLHTERPELYKEDKTKIQLPETQLTFSDFVFCFCFFLPFVPVRFKCFVCLSPCRRCRRKLTGAGASLPLWLLGNQTTRRWVWVNRRGRPVCQWVRTHSCSLLVRHKDPQPYTRTHAQSSSPTTSQSFH